MRRRRGYGPTERDLSAEDSIRQEVDRAITRSLPAPTSLRPVCELCHQVTASTYAITIRPVGVPPGRRGRGGVTIYSCRNCVDRLLAHIIPGYRPRASRRLPTD